MHIEEWRPLAERFNLVPALLSDTAARNMALLPAASARMLEPQAATGARYDVTDGGIAVIPIAGTLIANYRGMNDWLTGYDAVEQQLALAVADPGVAGIALVVDSHGGQVSGCFECADAIAAAHAAKPVWALAKHNALSGGYALASAAGRLYGTTTARVGSVGVVLMHLDLSGALERAGLTVNLIYSGARKVDGNPFAPLPDDVRERLQSEVDSAREVFAGRVARARGLAVAEVLASEAGIFGLTEAAAHGLADGERAVHDFFAEFREFLGRRSTGATATPGAAPSTHRSTGEHPMSDQSAGGEAPMTSEQLAAARAEGAAAERERIAGILACDEAKDRGEQAVYLATRTGLSVAEARGVLAASPTAKPAGSPLDHAMAAEPVPDIGPGAGDDLAAAARPMKTSGEWIEARRAKVQQLKRLG
jgi:ClpP class serine protease